MKAIKTSDTKVMVVRRSKPMVRHVAPQMHASDSVTIDQSASKWEESIRRSGPRGLSSRWAGGHAAINSGNARKCINNYTKV